ncbi:MAG: S-layer homology domain-containing protein [Deltaproteobacteria bacterium]
MKKQFIRALFVVTIFFAFFQINCLAASFTSHWAYESYLIAKEDNWLVTEDAGDFAPDLPSTRERAVATLVQAWEMAVINGKTENYLKSPSNDPLNKFADTSKISPRFKNAIAVAVGSGIIQGSGNKINPKGNITRAEFAVILSKIIKMPSNTSKSVFKDKLPAWASTAILKAYSAGLISGYPDKTFKPQKAISNAEVLSMIKKWAYGENIYSALNDAQLKRLNSYPEVKGDYYLNNLQYRNENKEEFHRLARAAKEYVTLLGTYSYKDLQNTQKREAYKSIYLKYCLNSPENVQRIDKYIDNIIKTKRIKSTRFLISSTTIYRHGSYNAASIRGIEEFKMLEGTPADAGTKTGKTYQRDIELIIQQTVNGIRLFEAKNLSKPVLVK